MTAYRSNKKCKIGLFLVLSKSRRAHSSTWATNTIQWCNVQNILLADDKTMLIYCRRLFLQVRRQSCINTGSCCASETKKCQQIQNETFQRFGPLDRLRIHHFGQTDIVIDLSITRTHTYYEHHYTNTLLHPAMRRMILTVANANGLGFSWSLSPDRTGGCLHQGGLQQLVFATNHFSRVELAWKRYGDR